MVVLGRRATLSGKPVTPAKDATFEFFQGKFVALAALGAGLASEPLASTLTGVGKVRTRTHSALVQATSM